MVIVPLQATPSQTVNIQLGTQPCTLNVYQLSTGLFMDVFNNNVAVVLGVLCLNCNLIVRSSYLGFIGDFIWIDESVTVQAVGKDPSFPGISTQFNLAYLASSDIPAGLGVGVS